MNELLSCSSCESTRPCERTSREETVTIKGRPVSYTAVFCRCTVCGEEFELPEQIDANLDAAREAWKRKYASPSPEELVALRERYGASQKAFGRILGFGELTINSYEQGAIPDSTNRLLLALANEPAIFCAMYDINKDTIGALQRKRIEASPGYFEGATWSGLEALAGHLTTLQQKTIEACAWSSGHSVPEKISTWTAQASFGEYDRLITNARRTDSKSETLAAMPAASRLFTLETRSA